MDKINFIDIYSELKSTSSSIVDISEKTQKYIQESASEYEKLTVIDYCFATFFAVLMFATAPAIFSHYYDFIIGVEPHLESALSQREYIEANNYVNISSFFVVFAVPFYTLVMPFFPAIKGLNPLKLVKLNFVYFTYAFLINYIALLIPLLFAASYAWLSDTTLSYFLVVWLLIPGFFVAIIPLFLFAFLTGLIFDVRIKVDEKSGLLPSKISYELADLLKNINSYNQKEADHKVKNKLIEKIDKIAFLVKSMRYHILATDHMDIHLENRFLVASKAVESLKLCILLPKGNSQKLLNRKIESIFNIFLSGNYFDLPNASYVPFKIEKKLIKSSSVKHFFSMLTVASIITAPLLVWVALMWLYEPTISATVQPLLPVMYSIWCLMVILSFSEKLAPDAKNMIVDMFKLLLNKK
jgi:hypothetical protein